MTQRVESKTGLEFDLLRLREPFRGTTKAEKGVHDCSRVCASLITASLFRHLVAFQRNRTLSVHNTAVD